MRSAQPSAPNYQQAGLLDQVSQDMHAAPLAEYVNRKGRVFASVALW
jgi:3-(3-hydroxy-phenyl)propionate hydroxylase